MTEGPWILACILGTSRESRVLKQPIVLFPLNLPYSVKLVENINGLLVSEVVQKTSTAESLRKVVRIFLLFRLS